MNNRPARVISTVFVVVGAIGTALVIGGGALRGAAAYGPTAGSWSAQADGVDALVVNGARAEVEIAFADVGEATLEASTDEAPIGNWGLRRNGSTLEVTREPSGPFWGSWGMRDWGMGLDGRGGEERVVLTLPIELERTRLDADFTLSAGRLTLTNSWGDLDIALNAGTVDFNGSAESLGLVIRGGMADVTATVASNARFETHAGRIQGAIEGEQPDSITVTANASTVDLTVPDGAYAVTEGTGTAAVTVDVERSRDATSTIAVSANAASVTMQSP